MDVKRSSSTSCTAAQGKRRSASSGISSTVVERKEIERTRRQHMKSLCVKLASLIPKEHYASKDMITQQDCLDEAAAYIKKLKERVDELRQKTSSARLMAAGMRGGASTSAATTTSGGGAGSEEADDDEAVAAPPVVEVRQHHDGSILDVVLISSVERPFKLHEVVTVLEEEGAEILNANFSVAGRKIFYTIHSRAFSSRIGIEVSRVSERLKALCRCG
ncbi:hypothetical protein BS78_03G088400 [Paspalum vaginatum]|nr:hypothetical protein BS78_03G088400 [Paspalum vaginatum]